ncbi:MAG TPA: SMP-30/gluconolactonase/LRE family protein [Cytophagaceae bacterium]|jgi:sugar lactone lactonase YvrE
MKILKHFPLLSLLLLNLIAACQNQNTDLIKAGILKEGSKIEKAVGGFEFTEGPAWSPEGYLLFSDIPANKIYKYMPTGVVSEFRTPSHNSNGLAFDNEGSLIICEHSSRGLRKVNKEGKETLIASLFDGKKLNSPNDLAIHSNGSIYFTDPPYGLKEGDQDSAKHISYNGIYRLRRGEVTLMDTSMVRPNGIAFSPDEKYVYVAQSEKYPHWKRFELAPDGSFKKGALFFDAAKLSGDGTPDGMKCDIQGNLYCSAPGGIAIFNKQGKHLGTIEVPEVTANCAFGDVDKKTLYITANKSLYKIRVAIKGK